MSDRNWNLFLVEDNDDDAFIAERAIKSASLPVNIIRCKDGEAAVNRLNASREEGSSESLVPHLVLLDLKIPLRSGLEVLRWIREDPMLHSLIVVALTSSSERRDLNDAYDLNVNSYLVKPSSIAAMTDLMRSVGKVWIDQFDRLFPALG
jgi:two-component system response regulator